MSVLSISVFILKALTPAAASAEAETVVLEEKTEHRSAEEIKSANQRMQPLLTAVNEDQHHLSSLSPAVCTPFFLVIILCFK